MHGSYNASDRPAVSIILPTYNRASFLPQAFASIRAQEYTDWELIVVDDGSTDDTEAVVATLAAEAGFSVRYLRQANSGAAAARNTGLEHTRGRFVAFLDSDDVWLPHHLRNCVDELQSHSDLDWVFAASRGVALPENRVLWANSLYENGVPRALLRLENERRGALHVLTHRDVLSCAIAQGFDAGLQLSVFRATVFSRMRLPEYKIGEDQVFLLQALARGMRLACLDSVHTIYHIHNNNLSLASEKSAQTRLGLMQELAWGLESVLREESLRPNEIRALRRRLSAEYAWHMAFPLAEEGRYADALPLFRKGLSFYPWNLRLWKTFLVAWIRNLVAARSNTRRTRTMQSDA